MNHLNIIEVENLCFDYISYDEDGKEVGRNPVLKDVSLSVPEGQFLAVLGHNGCGKSTLAKHFNAILTPTSGKVTVAGIDTSDEDKLFDIRQTVGMVFQNPDNQFVSSVLEEDIAFGLENAQVPEREVTSKVKEALELVGLEGYEKRSPSSLSGGQKQRAALAGVLALNPEILIFDEATSALDNESEKVVQDSLEKLAKNRTTFVIAHRLSTVQNSDVIMVLNHGHIIERGTHEKLLDQRRPYYQLYTGAFELE